MYNFIVNSVKHINTHVSKKTVNNLGQIKLEKVKRTLKLYSDKLSSKYRDVGEKCIEKGWYYR